MILTRARGSDVPFPEHLQLCRDLEHCQIDSATGQVKPPNVQLPEHPDIQLTNPAELCKLLNSEFWAEQLEAAAPNLWILSTPSGTSIRPLHKQRVRGREIIITENPRLHLTWFRDRIFIKPLPGYLLSYKFWELFLSEDASRPPRVGIQERRAILGFIRTYAYLIRHKSDFHIAQQENIRLIPEYLSWHDTCLFLSEIRSITDDEVSPRYHFGELRLSRLNLYAPFLFGKFYYERLQGHLIDRLGDLFKPLLSVFAIVTVVLNCMQVVMTVEQVSSNGWVAVWNISRYFSVICLITVTLVAVIFVFLWLRTVVHEWRFAIAEHWRMKREQTRHGKSYT